MLYAVRIGTKDIRLRNPIFREEAAAIAKMMSVGGLMQILAVRMFIEQHSVSVSEKLTPQEAEALCRYVTFRVNQNDPFPIKQDADYYSRR